MAKENDDGDVGEKGEKGAKGEVWQGEVWKPPADAEDDAPLAPGAYMQTYLHTSLN